MSENRVTDVWEFDEIELNDEEWQEPEEERSIFRREALILLIALLLPAILVLVEVLTGSVSTVFESSAPVVPVLPPSVHF